MSDSSDDDGGGSGAGGDGCDGNAQSHIQRAMISLKIRITS